jgi:hypothetical protein
MNQRLIKETRDLLPFFAGVLVLIIGPYPIWHEYAAVFGYITFGLGCVVLGGCSFGNELHNRTLSLLLSQPIDRAVLWREKMLVLGAALGMSLGVLLLCLQVTYPGINGQWWQAALVALCAFCGAPYWTLLLRQGLGGMAFAAAVPVLISLAARLVTDRLVENQAVRAYPAIGVLLIYCAIVHGLGYSRFRRLQVLDGASAELSLPAGLEDKLSRPLSRIASRFRGAFASLVKKELRLQQISFLLAGLFFLIALAGVCVIPFRSEWGPNIVGGDFIIYVFVLPLIAGVVSVAEEKGWGLAEWHLTLPPSALKQWSAKMLAALSTSLVLGLVLPAVMFFAGEVLLARGGAKASLPSAPQILCLVLGQLLLTSVAIYAASFTNTTLKAILAALAIIIAGWGASALALGFATRFIRPRLREHMFPPIHLQSPQYLWESLIPLLVAGCLGVFLCLLLWLACSNFRRQSVSAVNIVSQLVVLVGTLWLMSLSVALIVFIIGSSGYYYTMPPHHPHLLHR